MKNFTITKRDGSKDRFSLDKIMNAIIKAFDSVNEPTDLAMVSKVLYNIDIHDDIKVEDIQNQVEVALMKEGFYNVAKSFIVYRQQHTEDREVLEKMHFLTDYCRAENAATGSKFDANANVENKNIATLIGELPKQGFIRLNRRLLTDRIKHMYGKELSEEYIRLLTHHFIYKNDETNLANYCASITMAHRWNYINWRQLHPAYQPQKLLWRLYKYGVYGFKHVGRSVRNTRIFDVHELFHTARIRQRLLEKSW